MKITFKHGHTPTWNVKTIFFSDDGKYIYLTEWNYNHDIERIAHTNIIRIEEE